jgi:hypothetical protein
MPPIAILRDIFDAWLIAAAAAIFRRRLLTPPLPDAIPPPALMALRHVFLFRRLSAADRVFGFLLHAFTLSPMPPFSRRRQRFRSRRFFDFATDAADYSADAADTGFSPLRQRRLFPLFHAAGRRCDADAAAPPLRRRLFEEAADIRLPLFLSFIFDAAAACLMSLMPLRRHYAAAADIFHADDALPPHDAIAAIQLIAVIALFFAAFRCLIHYFRRH